MNCPTARYDYDEFRSKVKLGSEQPAFIVAAETDIAWAAGLFDGEGCITIDRIPTTSKKGAINDSFVLRLQVLMCDRDACERLRLIFGVGTVVSRKKRPSGYKGLPWSWRVTNEAAADVLRAMWPYMTVKRDEARAALTFAALPKVKDCRNGVPPELQAARLQFRQELQKMKPRNQSIARKKAMGIPPSQPWTALRSSFSDGTERA